jgi:small subunit ribosomal protein S21
MLKVIVRNEENIDRAIKRYRNKVRKTKQLQQLRSAKFFTKKSELKREVFAKARHRQFLQDLEDR